MRFKKNIRTFIGKKWKDISDDLQVLFFRLFLSKPDIVISFGISLGDDLLCTIPAKRLRQKGYKKIWMMTQFPEIFLNNPNIDKIIKKNSNGNVSKAMRDYLKKIKARVVHPWYTKYDKTTDRDIIPEKHIVHIMCDKTNVPYPEILKPEIYLTASEKKKGKLFNNQICIHSTGSGARQPMHTKDWYPERFQEVVDILKTKYTIIQLGSAGDTFLQGAIDMRGKTTIRETAAILYRSEFFIGQVGFLMHLARAVDCRSVIIYGGRERPDQSGYDFNINLYSPVSCSPCWYWNNCPYSKICMDKISAKDVIKGVEQLLSFNNKEVQVFAREEFQY